MSLSPTQRKALRRLGHDRKAIVLVGSGGVSAGVLAELELALASHELVKVRVRVGERDDRDALIASMCERTGADLVQRIGHVALLYRAHPESPRLALPDGGSDPDPNA